MTTDIRLAFAHPEERAVASASADPRDRISLRDHIVEVEIGAFQQEVTQRIKWINLQGCLKSRIMKFAPCLFHPETNSGCLCSRGHFR